MKTNPKITIVIVTHNARHYIQDCLESVWHQNYPSAAVRVVVVDNDSSDSTVGFIREVFPWVKVIENRTNRGFAEANNQGYFLALKNGSEYLALLNQDTIVSRDWLRRLVDAISSRPKIAGVQPKILLHPETSLINSFGNSLHFLGFAYCNKYRQPDKERETAPFEVSYLSGAACLLKMSALKETGLFDERLFMYHEDVDLGWRLRLNGQRLLVDPLAVVYHKYSFSKAKYKFYYMERNRLVVTLEIYHLATLILFFPAWLAMEAGIIALAVKNGWWREKLKGYRWVIFHWPSILSRRLDYQFKLRRVKDRDVLRLFTGSIKFQEVSYWPLTLVINPLMELYFWLAKKIIFW